ncbi:MAG: hypothetical protein JWQ25_1654 [Daejeonella sp.]|nr:hypothetical protein [Daejeonella sp.]
MLGCYFLSVFLVKAQTTPGPEETKLAGAICDCLSKLDFTIIKTKQGAEVAFADCFGQQSGQLTAVADERKVDITDNPGMQKLGMDVAKDLFAQNCQPFLKISMLMAADEIKDMGLTGDDKGRFVRIETKGFNYFVLMNAEKKEHSFIWFRQFPGSENFIKNPAYLIGKSVKIEWQEVEVFIPSAKKYAKMKEVTGVQAIQ